MSTAGKLWLGFGLLMLFLVGIGLFVAHRLASIERAISTIMAVQEPASAIAYEMALNVSGSRAALLAYVGDGETSHRAKIAANRVVLDRMIQHYEQVAQSRATLELGREIQARQDEIHLVGDSLMALSDIERAGIARFGRATAGTRLILNRDVLAKLDTHRNGPRKQALANQLAANLNGVAAAVGLYRATHDPDERARVGALAEDTRRALADLGDLRLSESERPGFQRFRAAFADQVAAAHDCLDDRDRLRIALARYAALANQLEHVVDQGIHGVTRTDLAEAAQGARYSIRASMIAVLVLLIAGILIGGLTALPVGQSIVRYEKTLRERMGSLTVMHERKDEFLGVLGHELRNPLAPLSNALYVLESRAPEMPTDVRLTHAMMKRQVDNMTRLVDDLLDVSRINQGKITLHREPVSLTEILGEAVEDFRSRANAQRVELALSLPGSTVWVDGDRIRLAQIVANLLNNAIKYTPAGGRITLALSQDGRDALVRVIDTGAGIPADMLERIFDPFTQVDPSITRGHGGLGIGLSLVSRLVEMHGGSIRASSPGIGKGSTFTLRLPRIEPPRVVSVEAARHDDARVARRVLVVDDNRDSAETLADLLRLWGHDVQLAHDGREAVARAEASRPEVVLLDIGLPGMDGYEVAERLRRESPAPGMTLIALTGFGQSEDRRRAVDAGFDHHLTKPVHPPTLKRLIESET